MARFDVYRNTGPHATDTPYLLDVQSDLLDGLSTRVVIPLRRRHDAPASKIPENLSPALDILGEKCTLETPKLAAVPLRILKNPVASLRESQNTVTAALDFLFHGF